MIQTYVTAIIGRGVNGVSKLIKEVLASLCSHNDLH